MRTLIPALIAFTFLATPVLAADCPAIEGEEVKDEFVQGFKAAAEKMGAPCAASFKQLSPGQAVIKYLPEGQKLEDWKSQLSVNVFTVDGAPGNETQAMTNNFLARVGQEEGHGEIVKKVAGERGAMFVIRYQVPEDKYKVHAIAIIRPVGPDKVAAIHWKMRDDVPNDTTLTLFQEINGIDVKVPAVAVDDDEAAAPEKAKPAPKKVEEKPAEKPVEAKPVEEKAAEPVEKKTEEKKPEEKKPAEEKPAAKADEKTEIQPPSQPAE